VSEISLVFLLLDFFIFILFAMTELHVIIIFLLSAFLNTGSHGLFPGEYILNL
jgi:hypothetical protein